MAVASVEPIFTGSDNEAVGQDQQQQAKGTFTVKAGLAQMLKGGIIMDVVNAQQARIAEEAGACAVMALEKVPADIRRDGGVARMADPKVLRSSKILDLYYTSHCYSYSLMTMLECFDVTAAVSLLSCDYTVM